MIAARLPGRTDNEIKNFWNTHMRKRLIRSGIDPNTHQPITTSNTLLENFATIQLLRNLLQLLNPDPFPSGSQLYDNILLQFPSTVPNIEHVNLSSNSQPVMDTCGVIWELEDGKNSNTDWLPGLVPATPGIWSGDQLVGNENYSEEEVDQKVHGELLMSSEKYDDRTVDDEGSASFWKDILHQSFLPSESL